MTTDTAEIRTYGGWRLSRGIGVGKLDSRQTLAFLVLVGAVTLLTAFGGLRVGVITASVAVVVMALLLWRRDGILLIDYAAAATRYQLARARGETSYRGQVMCRWPRSATLPEVLATTELLDVEVPGHGRSGMVWDRRSGLLSSTMLLGTGGTLLTDQADTERYVASWGALLANLADQPAIRWATVTVEITPGDGHALNRDQANRLDPEAPAFATQVLEALAKVAPAASSHVETRLTVTVDASHGGTRVKDLHEGAAQALRTLGVVNPSAAGAEVIRRATATDLIRMVRTAYDPSARLVSLIEWEATDLTWSDAGPVGAEELPSEYHHDGAISVTWALLQAPRQRVAHSVLLRLLSPARFPRRVTIAYRVLDRDEAGGLLERELTAADTRAAYRQRTKRDENARERRDRELSSVQAEEEAAGAGLVQFSIFVTTTVTDAADLPSAKAEVEAAAAGSRLKLRVARFGQSAAFAAGLPCGVTAVREEPSMRKRSRRSEPSNSTARSDKRRFRSTVAPAHGWRGPASGRSAAVVPGSLFLASTTQVAGLFPFVQAAGLPATGIPIGRDLLTAELVCVDPPGWVGKLTSNPGMWVQAQPGVGKSAITKRVLLGLVALGYVGLVPADVKGEYAALVSACKGQVVRVGRGLDRINPLDSGPLGRSLPRLSGDQRKALATEVAARRADLVVALLSTPNGLNRRPAPGEQFVLNAAVRLLTDVHAGDADPVITDVVHILRNPSGPLLSAVMIDYPATFRDRYSELIFALENLVSGPLSGLFDGPTTRPIELTAKAVSVDLSSLLTAEDAVIAAGMLATWAYSHGAIDAAAALGISTRPRVIPLDEFWRVLRAGAGMVDSCDSLTRLNRQKGAVTIMVTHSLRDTEALPRPEDRAKAAGLMERCDTLILGASSHSELEAVRARKPLSTEEVRLISSWANPIGTAIDGTDQKHPGRGKYLIKIGHRIGVPVGLQLDPAEEVLYDTDGAMRTTGLQAQEPTVAQ